MTQNKDMFNYAHEIKHNLLLLACFLKNIHFSASSYMYV